MQIRITNSRYWYLEGETYILRGFGTGAMGDNYDVDASRSDVDGRDVDGRVCRDDAVLTGVSYAHERKDWIRANWDNESYGAHLATLLLSRAVGFNSPIRIHIPKLCDPLYVVRMDDAIIEVASVIGCPPGDVFQDLEWAMATNVFQDLEWAMATTRNTVGSDNKATLAKAEERATAAEAGRDEAVAARLDSHDKLVEAEAIIDMQGKVIAGRGVELADALALLGVANDANQKLVDYQDTKTAEVSAAYVDLRKVVGERDAGIAERNELEAELFRSGAADWVMRNSIIVTLIVGVIGGSGALVAEVLRPSNNVIYTRHVMRQVRRASHEVGVEGFDRAVDGGYETGKDAWGQPFRVYDKGEQGIVVRSAGVDEVYHTADDVVED